MLTRYLRRLSLFLLCFASPALAEVWEEQCNKNAFVAENQTLNTGPEIDLFNWLAHGNTSATIMDGLILSFEKLENVDTRSADKALYRRVIGTYSDQNSDYPAANIARNAVLLKLRSDPRWMTLTHITEFSDATASPLYNPYLDANGAIRQNAADIKRGFEAGLEQLSGRFQDRLTQHLTSGAFTHVFFMSMGWNNDQGVSLCRYNRLMIETTAAMKAQDPTFRPFIVGITWPSVWASDKANVFLRKGGHITSVFNKANDADEIGVLYGNLLVNRIIPQANRRNLPFTVIGHSYGARLAGRALYSRKLLIGGPEDSGPDLALMLQPAYSAQRHMPGKGIEGYPFADQTGLATKVFATTSKEDTANPLAVWSPHFGGRRGLSRAKRNPDIFRFIPPHKQLEKTLAALPGATAQKPTAIDATEFVYDHSDIYDAAVGQLLAHLLITYAK